MAKLTDAAVRKFVPHPKKRRFIRDDGAQSLFLCIQPSGHRSWLMRFRINGRIAKLVLGPLHTGDEVAGPPVIGMPLTLAGARQVAAEVLRERALGKDVAADHRARKLRQRDEQVERAATTFDACLRQFFREYKVKKSRTRPRRWYETARLLGLAYPLGCDPGKTEPEVIRDGLAQRWGDRPVATIDEADVVVVLDEAKRKRVPGIEPRTPGINEARVRHLHSALSTFFAWLKTERKISQNPMRDLARPEAPAARERLLKPHEIVWFWKACDAVGEPFGTIFKMLLLTGCRLREVAGMRHDELGGFFPGTPEGIWSIPGQRTKNRLPHVVPLSPAAQALIAKVATEHALVFTTNKRSPPSGWSRAKSRLDELMLGIAKKERSKDVEIPDWRLHDLRRTFVTGLGDLAVRPDVIELCVNHVSGSRAGVAGTYNRSELMDERRAALARWAQHVAALVEGKPANVVSLPRKRR